MPCTIWQIAPLNWEVSNLPNVPHGASWRVMASKVESIWRVPPEVSKATEPQLATARSTTCHDYLPRSNRYPRSGPPKHFDTPDGPLARREPIQAQPSIPPPQPDIGSATQ